LEGKLSEENCPWLALSSSLTGIINRFSSTNDV
jgi:hypothetical protein